MHSALTAESKMEKASSTKIHTHVEEMGFHVATYYLASGQVNPMSHKVVIGMAERVDLTMVSCG